MTGPPIAGAGDPYPRQVVRAEGGFAYGVVGADLHVFGDGQPVYVLENWRAVPPADDAWLRELPSRMLSARHEIVPFTGRAADLAALHAWRLMDRRLAARWLHGPGGQGKTRLAARFARESLADGWKVVSAVHGPGSVLPPPGSQDLTTDGAAGLLLVVDYADQWPLPHLTWLFSNALLHRPGLPTRLLLLGRTADAWPAVRATLADLQAATAGHPLTPLPADDPDGADGTDGTDGGSDAAGGPGERARMFRAARDSFAARHGLPTAADIAPPMPLSGPDFGLTLTVHMAALVAVEAHRAGRRPPRDTAGLTTYLLDREQRQWARRWDRQATPDATPPDGMNRTVFAAALTGPLAPRAGVTALASLGAGGPRPAERALTDHARHYPPADPARPTVLEPLTPDRLAEDFVALTLPGHSADYPAQDWAPSALHALLPHDAGTPTAPWTPRALTLVAAAADRWPHVRTGYLDPLLREAPWLAVAAGGGALGAVAALADLDIEVLAAVAAHLPNRDDADLDPAGAVLAVRLADHRLAATDDPAERAAIHLDLGWSLAGAGRYAESLAATERGTAGYEALARADPDRYEHELARALNNLSLRYDRERRTEEAVAAMERSVEIRRRRLTDPVGRHAADLALSLSNYGNLLKHAGRWLESLQAGSEALARYGRLAAAHPGAYRADLAIALLNHGADLSAALRKEAAIDATRQAVTVLRELAADHPAAYEGTLASGLANLASLLTEQGKHAEELLTWHLGSGGAPDPELLPPPRWREEALAAIEQAVEIDRRRARANPAALEATLAGTLRTSAAVRHACGMEAMALTDEREAAALSDRLGDAAEPHRAERQATYGSQVVPDVLDDVQLTLYHHLASADLATHGPHFAMLLDLHRPTAADGPPRTHDLAALREAVEVRARLAALDPVTHEPDHAYALTRLADALWWEGEHAESAPVTERAVEVTARLAAVDPEEYGPPLALARRNLVHRLAATGRRREARALRRAHRRVDS
ncbi:tetratricopeptide repeat protein [Streptomyces sp. DSM 44918]|uniref:Tetratricopeptide repeat protein n=1 Tax=Streptomyces millisiae TaxID=3075542 RepID=A0ABU2LHR2_9ACTN|nr:tetratricopeptide repeat protein [Streptomyces sp. DSM 44918]